MIHILCMAFGVSEKLKQYYEDHPEAKQAISDKLKKHFEDPDVRKAASEKSIAWWNNHPELKSQKIKVGHSDAMKKKWEDPVFREKMLCIHKENTRRRGIKHTGETRKKMSDGVLLAYAEGRKKPVGFHYSTLSDDQKYLRSLKITEANYGGFWYGAVTYINPRKKYCEKWTPEFKERVRAFFGHCCVECGTPQGKKKLHVHHVWYNKESCCDDTPRTFVALCHSCHSKTQPLIGNTEYWSKHFQEIIDTYYGGECYLPRKDDC